MNKMQRVLKLFKEWCAGVGSLSANPDKTQCIFFEIKRSLGTSRGPTFYGKSLNISKEVKYLSVVLDDKLNWKAHREHATAEFLHGYWLCRLMVK